MDFQKDFENISIKILTEIFLKMFLRFFLFGSGKALKIPTENLSENLN